MLHWLCLTRSATTDICSSAGKVTDWLKASQVLRVNKNQQLNEYQQQWALRQ